MGALNIDTVLEVEHHPRVGETVRTRSSSILPEGKGGNQAVAAARSTHRRPEAQQWCSV